VSERRSREENKARTRARLLEAAAKVFALRGYHRAAVEEIAQEAGYSTGAVYSNFTGKEDLFLALLDDHLAQTVREVSEAVHRGGTAVERAQAAAGQWMGSFERDRDLFLLFIEFWSYAVRDPELRPRIAARFGAFRDATTRLIEEAAGELGLTSSMPPAHLAIAVNALADGIALEKLVDPDAIPDELFADTLALLFGTLASAAERPAGHTA
jgi:AcrR family transcriptional regulator